MTVLEHDPPRTGDRVVLWTWIAVILAPIGLVLGVVVAFVLGEAVDHWYLGPVPALVALAAPTAAAVLAARTAEAAHRSGPAAVVVSGLLLLAALVALPTVVYSFEGFLLVVSAVGLAAVVVAFGVETVRSHGRHRPG